MTPAPEAIPAPQPLTPPRSLQIGILAILFPFIFLAIGEGRGWAEAGQRLAG